jgi:gamma-glutamyltranspeptidase/glutathione hydrolase
MTRAPETGGRPAGFDWAFPYASQKMPTVADCMVCTSQPVAGLAGLAALQRGGNAVDAALASAITLTVVDPVMNGLGGDTLALVWDGTAVQGLNGSGRAPAAWSAERFAGRASMPGEGWDSATVPGTVAAWADLSKRYGKLAFASLFEAAVRYAEEGYLVSPIVARQWAAQSARVAGQPGFAAAYLPSGSAPRAGDRFKLPGQARTLRAIAEGGAQAFYRGELARAMADDCRAHGGAMSEADLADHRSEWVSSMQGRYRDLGVHQLPPNAQGLAVLIALGILEHFDFSGRAPGDAARIHVQVEAMRIAFREVYASVCDPAYAKVDWSELVDPDRLARAARGIRQREARPEPAHALPSGGTVYVAAADRSGMIVSLIQSNYRGFGSGVVVPGTGICMHNRASCFSVDPAHPNAVRGGKRPFHTIIPALLSRAGKAVGALGVVGANMQPQGQVQLVANLADYGMNPQSAMDAPRWRIREDGKLMIEHGHDARLAGELSALGHDVIACERGNLEFGGAQMVHALREGYVGASDSRRDGIACGT